MALIAGAAALASGPAVAADVEGNFKVYGSGELLCERWLEDEREDNESAQQSQMWIAGYLTAFNQFVHKGADVTQPYDGAYILQWVDSYCRKRPNSQLIFAVRDLVMALRKHQ